MRNLLRPNSWIVITFRLESLRRYRRWWGGHWELWYVEICHTWLWHDVPECTGREQPKLQPGFWKGKSLDEVARLVWKNRPNPLCRGTPVCEDYSKPEDILDAEFIE